jgi:hypothetical protein
MPLDSLRKNIDDLGSFNWGDELNTIVESNTDSILQLQEDQMYEGKDIDGNDIALDGRGYSKRTFEIKEAKGQPTDRVTLKDTGAFYASLQVVVENGALEITGNTDYSAELIERTGESIFGLNQSKKEQFGENVVLPAIHQIYNSKTGFEIT